MIIEKYKNIDLDYNVDDGMIYFDFEGKERNVRYVFEAKRIIDEPFWEDCLLEGYFIDGYFDKFIGKAIAKRKDKKSGKPDWLYLGQYDSNYTIKRMGEKVYLKNEENDNIYSEWEKQKETYDLEMRKLNSIVIKLK